MTTEHLPTVHLNGTSEEALIEQLTDVMSHLERAIEAMKSATPNGRDYYPQSPQALVQAQQQHRDRISRLYVIYDELHDRALAISDGGHRA